MTKTLMFVLVAFMAVTAIMGRTADNKASAVTGSGEGKVCKRHGDPCSSAEQCCNGMRCNSQAHRCQVIITSDELQAQREKVLSGKAHVHRGSSEHTGSVQTSRTRNTCGRHGADCTSGDQCCDGLRCNSQANKCQVIITSEELQAQREKVLSGKAKVNRDSIERSASVQPSKTRSGNVCGRHGADCISSDQCCDGLRCHTYANKCQVIITSEELVAQREKIMGKKNQSN